MSFTGHADQAGAHIDLIVEFIGPPDAEDRKPRTQPPAEQCGRRRVGADQHEIGFIDGLLRRGHRLDRDFQLLMRLACKGFAVLRAPTVHQSPLDRTHGHSRLKRRQRQPAAADHRHGASFRIGETVDGETGGRADAQVAEWVAHQRDQLARADLKQQCRTLAAGDAHAQAAFVLRLESAHDHAHAAIHESERRHLLYFAVGLLAKSLLQHAHRLLEIEQRENFRASKQKCQIKNTFWLRDSAATPQASAIY